MAKKRTNNKPLTLNDLVQYNEEILFPALEARFVTKDEFKGFKDEMYSFKDRIDKFRDEALTNFDAILKKLDILLDEKQVADYQ